MSSPATLHLYEKVADYIGDAYKLAFYAVLRIYLGCLGTWCPKMGSFSVQTINRNRLRTALGGSLLRMEYGYFYSWARYLGMFATSFSPEIIADAPFAEVRPAPFALDHPRLKNIHSNGPKLRCNDALSLLA